jgi:hypothetical protein
MACDAQDGIRKQSACQAHLVFVLTIGIVDDKYGTHAQ